MSWDLLRQHGSVDVQLIMSASWCPTSAAPIGNTSKPLLHDVVISNMPVACFDEKRSAAFRARTCSRVQNA